MTPWEGFSAHDRFAPQIKEVFTRIEEQNCRSNCDVPWPQVSAFQVYPLDRTAIGSDPFPSMMFAASVIELTNLLTAAGIPVWLDGGWGVDALLGAQTRPHDDLDVVIALDHAADAQRVLSAQGFRLTEDERPTRFVMRDASDRRIDFHTVTFDSEGGGIQLLQNGASFRYPPEGFSAVGAVGGVQLHCLTAKVQMLCHCGYAPDDTDRHDVQLLHERFGLPLPPGYDA